ncbi:MAG TPA: peptidylprolyl isomerase [Gaiellaceae bacterium]|nr:peptidylprolyl isomerase [Gaiellaceae bacterium]
MALHRRLQLAGLVLALAVAAAGCGGGGSKKSALDCKVFSASPSGGRKQSPPTQALVAGKTYTVALKTNYGSFTIKLATKESPSTTASFVYLVNKGFFNGLIFHRIVPGFVIQGGDPTGTGEGGPGYECVDAPPASTQYTHGVVAMAKTGSDPFGTSGSQFFVVTAQNAQLPAQYAVLGTVVSGLPVVDKIGKFGNASEVPTKHVVIEKATVHVS